MLPFIPGVVAKIPPLGQDGRVCVEINEYFEAAAEICHKFNPCLYHLIIYNSKLTTSWHLSRCLRWYSRMAKFLSWDSDWGLLWGHFLWSHSHDVGVPLSWVINLGGWIIFEVDLDPNTDEIMAQRSEKRIWSPDWTAGPTSKLISIVNRPREIAACSMYDCIPQNYMTPK